MRNGGVEVPRRNFLIQGRKQVSLTQAEMADKLEIGRSFYARIELGVRTPSLKMGIKIASILGQPVEALFPDLASQEAGAAPPAPAPVPAVQPGRDPNKPLFRHFNVAGRQEQEGGAHR
jgi:DNA-binding XRE family transcriptional regulator